MPKVRKTRPRLGFTVDWEFEKVSDEVSKGDNCCVV